MKWNRTLNAQRNFITGSGERILQLLMRFVMRTVMIYTLGTEYLGLTNLFSSILQVLNLAELGVGTAMVYSMYRPIAENDEETVCALMALYRWYYRIIGAVILAAGLLLTPVLPKLIKGSIPGDLNLYILYYLNLAATVLTYWLFSYKNSILTAHQRSDVASKVNLVVDIIKYGIQAFVLVAFRNYYLYVIVILLSQIVVNISTAFIADRMYPDFHPRGKLDKSKTAEINSRISDLFVSKIGATIVSSADSIVISAFLGLTVLGIYQNYYFIVSAVVSISSAFFSACTAGIGNSLITESREKNFSDLRVITFVVIWATCFCSCCFLNLFQPFITLWVGEGNLLDFPIVMCLCGYFIVQEIYYIFCLFKDAAGIWHKDRFRPFVTALVNLAMNLIMVQYWGLYGVVLSTVLSMFFIGLPWLIHNLFTQIFQKEQMKPYLKELCAQVCIMIILCVVTGLACSRIEFSPLMTVVLRFLFCCLIPNLLYYIIYRKSWAFHQCCSVAGRFFKRHLT